VRNVLISLILLPVLLFSASGLAVTVANLNSVNVSVDSRSAKVMQQALPDALGKVLVRMSGNAAITTLPDIQNDLPNASRWLQSYSYQTVQNEDGQTQLQLHLVFDQKGLFTLLRDNNQPVWSAKRPLSLVWLQVADSNATDDTVVSSNDTTEYVADVMRAAKLRGVPVLLPVMDLQDQGFLNSDQDKDFDLSKLQQAAKRYAANDILAGNVLLGIDNQWSGEWLFYFNEQRYHWNNSGPSAQDVINAAVNKMADIMANQLAVMDNASLQSTYKVQIMGINNLSDFAKVIADLNQLPVVSKVVVDNMGKNVLVVDVTASGDEQGLVSAMAAQTHFAAIPNELSADGAADLYYRWVVDASTSAQQAS